MQIIENMTNEDYRKAKGISKTGLDLIAKSPAHFKGFVSEHSKAFDIGRAFHDIILTPDAYKNDYEILPQGFNSLLKASKERLQEIRGQGITPLSFDDSEAISAMRDSVMRLPLWRRSTTVIWCGWTFSRSRGLCRCCRWASTKSGSNAV